MRFLPLLITTIVLLGGCSLFSTGNSDEATIIIQTCQSLEGDISQNIPGKMVYSAEDTTGISQIYSMNADGSNLTQLTHFGPEGGGTNPTWSPDGQRIVFANYSEATTLGAYLYLIDADGQNMRPLKKMPYESPSALVGSAPAWSPEGTRIAYQACTNCEKGGSNYEIVTVEVDGKQYDSAQVHGVTDHPASDLSPTWSPDGTRIAFVSNRNYVNAKSERNRQDLYVINAYGNNLQRLTETGHVKNPSWAPDGKKIAFEGNIKGQGVYIFNITSGVISKIETGLESAGYTLWNDDGSQLLIVGKENEQLPLQMRLLSIANNSCTVMQTIPLDSKTTGRYYDWHAKKE